MAAVEAPPVWNGDKPPEMPKGLKKEFFTFLKSIASFKGDLASFTAPPFILSTTSMTEYPSYWAEQPSRFVAPAREDDPAKRSLLVLTWFLSTLKQQYFHRRERKGGKPLNPVLGELFLGKFADVDNGITNLVSEQVSHHPPVTAYKLWNDDAGISMTGFNVVKTFFANRTLNIHRIGQVVLNLNKYNEDHLITFPQLHLEGFFPPPPIPELDSETPVHIVSSSGYITKITFSGKGWFRGKRHSFVASVYKEGEESEPLYVAEGQWTGTFSVKDVRSDTLIEEYDASTSAERLTLISVPPLEEQDPMESRRLWGKFVAAMNRRDMAGVSAEKNRIEVRQRQMRLEEQKEGKTWELKYFSKAAVDPKLEALAAKVGFNIEPELTGGFWQFDREKYEHAEKRKDDPFGDAHTVSQ